MEQPVATLLGQIDIFDFSAALETLCEHESELAALETGEN